MSEHQPYNMNEPRFNRLPDENAAWEKMKAKLDGEEKKRRFLLPPFFTGCAGWGLLLLLIGGGLWWWAMNGDTEKVNENTRKKAPVAVQKTGNDSVLLRHKKEPAENEVADLEQRSTINQPQKKSTAQTIAKKNNKKTNEAIAKRKTVATTAYSKNAKTKTKRGASTVGNSTTSKGNRNILRNEGAETDQQSPITNVKREKDSSSSITTNDSTQAVINERDTTGIKDSTTLTPISDTIQQQQKPPQKNKRYLLAAGITLQQQIPLGDQQWTPYNYRGRKGSWADYIPAIDLRLHKGDQWFLQSGFRWGAPHYTRSFIYNRNFKTDTTGSVTGSTSYRLHKTYYHQVPLSFNYNIRPGLSAGVGVVWSKFYGAVSEKEEREQVTPTTDSLISKTWVRDKNDSLFRSSNTQLLLQVQYQWKRWWVGAQYTQGLQPYIEYRDAQGQTKKQKNSALNLFVRYQLWRQKP